ncbi:leucine-rich repeat and calponin homology domain-containing protein 4 isoform X2 [Pseudophryne corroboree]|uniref:leucine-rich repeat and calponin homology domain-containing protein 4 isoform X2 n=1 Tax=Pseudophryne corroboree TaxID=495146 RepID=UPI003081F633
MAAGNDDDEGGGGDGDPEFCPAELSPGPGSRRSADRALEEAASTGVLNLSGRRLKELPGSARNSDLTDVTRADLSRNRFSEVPGDLCHLVSLEYLNLYHNCLRSLPPSLSNLQVLTYLNISRNHLASLPLCLCRLPLTVLIAGNNKLNSIPEEVGAMTSLRQLDVSCNEIQSLPPQMGSLQSLRELNVRRNRLTSLPEELSELPLTRLDFSCNHVARIPVCYRHLQHLQTVILDNNPLQYPPAQICLKGKVHIFKYLNMEACSKPAADLGHLGKLSRPTSFTTCLTDDLFSSRGLDSGFNSVDSGSKRWSGNESADEQSDLSFRVSSLSKDTRQFREKVNGGDGDGEQPHFTDCTNEEDEEKSDTGLQMVVTPQDKRKPDLHSTPRTEDKTLVCSPEPPPPTLCARSDHPTEERRRPETLLIWKERERQQQLQQRQENLRRPSVDRKESGPSDNCTRGRSQGCPSNAQSPAQPTSLPADSSPTQKPNSFLFRSYSRGAVRNTAGSEQGTAEQSSPVRLRSSRPPPDEKALVAQLRKDIESHLKITLEEPLCECLANGVTLCQLLNNLRPRFIPFINVPSPAVPKLNPVKCRKNVDSFLDACRRLGVPERDLCSACDILGGERPHVVQRTVSSLLLLCASREASALPGVEATCPPSLQLLYQHHGFLLFYVLLMLTLYVAYSRLSL